jgi:DNA-binding NarL/FixJ family response regulator
MLDQSQDLRLLIISNEPLVRAGLSALLADQVGIDLVGQESSRTNLERTVMVFSPDVILWDLGWEQTHNEDRATQDALEQISELSSEGFSIVVLISSQDSAREVWIAGAKAILLRDVDLETLRISIIAAVNDLVVLDPSIGASLFPEFGSAEAVPTEELTARELQVLQQLAEGLPNKIIANQLGVSEHTIKFHINSIFRKMGVRSRTEAVVRAMQLGFIVL